MLEDRIIVQDRGIDAGLAALMQNANKGSMDPAALLAMMNNNGYRLVSFLCLINSVKNQQI